MDRLGESVVKRMARLAEERRVLEAKEAEVLATPEWQAYDREVERVIGQLEEEWLASTEPITKETVAAAHERWKVQVERVQNKHKALNDQRIAAYREHK